MQTWRLLDTGQRSASENMALDEALLLAKTEGSSPNTLRFLRFSPPAVLIGYHQSVAQEVREEFCKGEGIDINRRITGGGAIFFDETQIGWEVIARKDDFGLSFEPLFRKISNGVILGLKRLGLDARFRPKNDIEVGGRKISGTGGVEEGDAFLFQGTLLTDFDCTTMLKALRIPVEKLQDKEIEDVRDRVTWLKRELKYLPPLDQIKRVIVEGFEESLGVSIVPAPLTQYELKLFRERLPKFQSANWIYKNRDPRTEQQVIQSARKTRGGLVRVNLLVNLKRRIIQSALITGDFFCRPKRVIYDLEARLKNIRADRESIEKEIRSLFKGGGAEILGIGPCDLIDVFDEVISRLSYTEYGISIEEAGRVFVVNAQFSEIVKEAAVTYLLLPYCAKALDCEYRYKDGCEECGKCSVGEAYRIARDSRITPITITNFEHLRETLRRLRQSAVLAYVGSCCEAFYLRHREEFEASGIPAVLVDIESTTCYDLGKEQDAYLGRFERKTELRIGLLKKVLGLTSQAKTPEGAKTS